MAFSFMKAQIDADTQKYEATCQKRSEAGKLGGRPAKGEEEKQEKAKAPARKEMRGKTT